MKGGKDKEGDFTQMKLKGKGRWVPRGTVYLCQGGNSGSALKGDRLVPFKNAPVICILHTSIR